MLTHDQKVAAYRASTREREREADLLSLAGSGTTALDVGTRDGHFARLLTTRYEHVTALDLTMPAWSYPGVTTVTGDATRLEYPDNYFDLVFCAEVLEHIPDIEKACSEIRRVAKYAVVIGVPYRQDTRVGRTTCRNCQHICPPYGHVNTFTKDRLLHLFRGLEPERISYVGEIREATTNVATLLMDFGGNPWGSYEQEEPCIRCGAKLVKPGKRAFLPRIATAAAYQLNRLTRVINKPHANWIQIRFTKKPG